MLSRARREFLRCPSRSARSHLRTARTERLEGDPHARDGAYHQGTAWPFLLGAFTRALVHTAERRGDATALAAARAEVAALLAPLSEMLAAHGLGHLPEVFDGDAPHRPGGLLRAGLERLRGAARPRGGRARSAGVSEGGGQPRHWPKRHC